MAAINYISDIMKLDASEGICVIGYVQTKPRKFSTHFAFRVRDITGSILVLLSKNGDESDYSSLKRGARVQLTATLSLIQNGERVLKCDSGFRVLGRVNAQLSELDGEMREQASRMLLSRVCSLAGQVLRNEDFVEFDSRVISSQWVDEGLEPLLVVYPGFGSPVTLATSPAAQVLDFLTTTGALKAFTLSTSFTTTYRSARAAVESKVIMAKAIDMHEDQLISLAWKISIRILNRLLPVTPSEMSEAARPHVVRLEWPEKANVADLPNAVNVVIYSVEKTIVNPRWVTALTTLAHFVDTEGQLLVECAIETLGSTRIATLSLYPSHFLSFLQATPARQLRHLGNFNVWEQ